MERLCWLCYARVLLDKCQRMHKPGIPVDTNTRPSYAHICWTRLFVAPDVVTGALNRIHLIITAITHCPLCSNCFALKRVNGMFENRFLRSNRLMLLYQWGLYCQYLISRMLVSIKIRMKAAPPLELRRGGVWSWYRGTRGVYSDRAFLLQYFIC